MRSRPTRALLILGFGAAAFAAPPTWLRQPIAVSHVGPIDFINDSARPVRVLTYHPANVHCFLSASVPAGASRELRPSIESSWGFSIDRGPITPVADVADWRSGRFVATASFYEAFVSRGQSRRSFGSADDRIAATWIPVKSPVNVRVGHLEARNDSDASIKVLLFHPDAPRTIFATWYVRPRQHIRLGDAVYGEDWGVAVDGSAIRTLRDVERNPRMGLINLRWSPL